MGLGDQFSKVKQRYIEANKLFGDLIKVMWFLSRFISQGLTRDLA